MRSTARLGGKRERSRSPARALSCCSNDSRGMSAPKAGIGLGAEQQARSAAVVEHGGQVVQAAEVHVAHREGELVRRGDVAHEVGEGVAVDPLGAEVVEEVGAGGH